MKEGVPLQVVPLTDQYWQRVVSHSISEIRSGRTPNPDILCNSRQDIRVDKLSATPVCTHFSHHQ